MTILSCIPAAVAALLGFDASFLVVANSLPSRCVRLGVCPRARKFRLEPARISSRLIAATPTRWQSCKSASLAMETVRGAA
jgi:hypothetical protein